MNVHTRLTFWHACSLGLVVGLCGLACLQYRAGRPWWAIAITLALAVGLLVCGWMTTRDLGGRDDD
jgi:FtsH-binding integral membrane protein